MPQLKSSSPSARFDRSERGQSLVELAVSFTLIIFVLGGAVDFGRAYFDMIALRDAVQEGVVFASVNSDSLTDSQLEALVEDRIQESSTAPINFSTIPDSDIDLNWSHAGYHCAGFYDNGGTLEAYSVTVTIHYDFQLTMPMIQVMFPGGILPLTISDTNTILAPECE